ASGGWRSTIMFPRCSRSTRPMSSLAARFWTSCAAAADALAYAAALPVSHRKRSREYGHRGLASRRSRGSVCDFMVPKTNVHIHGVSYGRRVYLHDAADDSAIYVMLVVAPTRSGGREAEACLRCPARRRACGGAVRRAYRIVYSTTAIISISTIASG